MIIIVPLPTCSCPGGPPFRPFPPHMKRRVCGLHRDGSQRWPAWIGLTQATCVTFADLLENGHRRRGRGLNHRLQSPEKVSLRGLRKQEPRCVGTQQENILHCELSLASEPAWGSCWILGARLRGFHVPLVLTSLPGITFPESCHLITALYIVLWATNCSPLLHLCTVTPTHPSPQPP